MDWLLTVSNDGSSRNHEDHEGHEGHEEKRTTKDTEDTKGCGSAGRPAKQAVMTAGSGPMHEWQIGSAFAHRTRLRLLASLRDARRTGSACSVVSALSIVFRVFVIFVSS